MYCCSSRNFAKNGFSELMFGIIELENQHLDKFSQKKITVSMLCNKFELQTPGIFSLTKQGCISNGMVNLKY